MFGVPESCPLQKPACIDYVQHEQGCAVRTRHIFYTKWGIAI